MSNTKDTYIEVTCLDCFCIFDVLLTDKCPNCDSINFEETPEQ